MEFKNKKDITEEELNLFYTNKYVSIDTETTGLNFLEDQLCTIQLFSENIAILIRFDPNAEYKRLKELFTSSEVVKIFHNAVFDVSFLMQNLNLNNFQNIVCTKISSKIVNGLTHKNSLKPLLKEYLNIDISKNMQLSDWSSDILSKNQIEYAIDDVRYLRDLWILLKNQLNEKGLCSIAEDAFSYIPSYIRLKQMGIDDIFVY